MGLIVVPDGRPDELDGDRPLSVGVPENEFPEGNERARGGLRPLLAALADAPSAQSRAR